MQRYTRQRGLLCDLKCRDGYKRKAIIILAVGPVCCQTGCPSGYIDDGLLCRKRTGLLKVTAKISYGRGAGVPMDCGGGDKEANAGLC